MESVPRITPSEIELLAANNGRSEFIVGHITSRLSPDFKFSCSCLEEIFCKALAANASAGLLEFELEPARSFLVFKRPSRLMVRRNGSQQGWPEPSLEADLVRFVEQVSPGAECVRLAEVVRRWLAFAAIEHLQSALIWFYDALTARGCVRKEQEQRLDLFRLTRYVVPRSLQLWIGKSPAAPASGTIGDLPVKMVDLSVHIRREVERGLSVLAV